MLFRSESNSMRFKLDMIIDRKYRKKMKPYINYIITYSDNAFIYGIPTIPIMNGIVVNDIKRVSGRKKDKNIIHILAVALMQPYNGYEKVIRGMATYRALGGEKIQLHFVGDGPEKNMYVKLSNDLKLNDVIKFYGLMQGSDLDKIYEMSDMTLEVFERKKQGIKISSTLKSRESIARGLPVITGSKIDIFQKVYFPYVIEFSADESEIDMFKIEHFYESIMQNRSKVDLAIEIRRYAEENIDLIKILRPVLDCMRGMEKDE